jgi:protein phosphatase PTC7
MVLAVADGVGGWASHDVNPGLYSGLLTKQVVELGTKNPSASLEEIVHRANWNAAEKHLGSATCTALKLTGPNEITTLNVGDSGYSIHRKVDDRLTLVFASEVGQKRFNFPHQLGGKYGDNVEDVAVEMTHTLEANDIIVVYSDGVSDNIFPVEFHDCLDSAMGDEDTVQSFGLAADCIARKAYFLGKDKAFNSPFAQGARKAGWKNYRGGKHDDITVVVAQIGDTPALDDPYFDESIFLYTGPVGAVEDLPSLASLMTPTMGDEL